MDSLKKAMRNVKKAVAKADEVSKKLTTKTRKALKSSVFCGPNRSFPVNDCKHAATAKAYLNRSNFSAATKKRIASCINRRAKALGCPAGKPAKAKGGVEYSFDNLPEDLRILADSHIFKSTKELVDTSLKSEGGMDLDFSGCNDCE
jgi:hypothetical protein